MTYEQLIDEALSCNLKVKELELKGNKGRIKGNRIAIKKDIETTKEKACILAEELGHFHTTHGNILDQKIMSNRKQEYKARLWAYNKQIGLAGLVSAYNNGCRSLFEIAEFLDVCDDFLIDALTCYEYKYGKYTTLDNYIIYFIPNLSIIKLI